jgi:chromosome segregation ATPase
MNTETDQNTFLSRIGKWFKKDAASGNGNLPLEGEVHGHAGTSMEPRSTFLRPWAKRDAAIQNLQQGFDTLTDLMGSIRDNLDKQNARQDQLIQTLAQLPQTLQTLPESTRVQSETLKAIHTQIEYQNGQQQKLGDILERISAADAQHRSTLDALTERVESLNDQDARMADNLNNVGSAMQSVSKTSEQSAAVLSQMRDNLNSRDGELERILQRQGNRFTTMLAVAIFLSIAALVAVGVIGYLMYEGLKQGRIQL